MDHRVAESSALRMREGSRLFVCAEGHAVEFLHHVERSADDLLVIGEPDRGRYGNGGVSQRGENSIFATHVVRRGKHQSMGRTAKNPAAVAIAELVSRVRTAASDEPGGE